jgi:hypothetical protein
MGLPYAFKGFAENPSQIVEQAASILEEELAAGIVAAKKAEEKFVNVREIRSGDPNDVFQRFRRDSHEVLELFLDAFGAAVKTLEDGSQGIITVRSEDSQPKSKQSTTGSLPTLTMPEPIKPGKSGKVTMSLRNDSDEPTGRFNFLQSGLTSASGYRIPARQVKFTPTAPNIGPHEAEKVLVTLKVPAKTPPDNYYGLIQVKKLDKFKAVLVAQVT